MIDLHCHILPAIDDGAATVDEALAMASSFAAQGVTHVACTPHILPGVYPNSGPQIRQHVARLQEHVDAAGIRLNLVTGADNHIVPDFSDQIRSGNLLTLADSKYVLVEPPHHVAPARLDELFFSILLSGYVPILTHPERLTWIERKYDLIKSLTQKGVWMQVTSGSLRGAFGKRAQYWAEKMLCEGAVHILATDAHNTQRRRPDLAEGRLHAERLVGSKMSETLVVGRPEMVLFDRDPALATVGMSEFVESLSHEKSSSRRGATIIDRMRSIFG